MQSVPSSKDDGDRRIAHAHNMKGCDAMLTKRRTVTIDTLNEEMDFDSVIYSHGDGTVSDVDPSSMHAPGVYIAELADGTWIEEAMDEPWELLNGFSGQYGYSGPHMHASEYIGGGLARHILETEGFYVVTVVTPMPLDEDEDVDFDEWVVAYAETADV